MAIYAILFNTAPGSDCSVNGSSYFVVLGSSSQFHERLFQIFHFENITLFCCPHDILDLIEAEKYCLVLGALGENSVKFLTEVQTNRLFACPLKFYAELSSGDPGPCPSSCGISWESTPLLLLLEEFMKIPFSPMLPEALGLCFCVPWCVSGAPEYLIRSTVVHV